MNLAILKFLVLPLKSFRYRDMLSAGLDKFTSLFVVLLFLYFAFFLYIKLKILHTLNMNTPIGLITD